MRGGSLEGREFHELPLGVFAEVFAGQLLREAETVGCGSRRSLSGGFGKKFSEAGM
jgi:hypothetical protein